MEIIALSVDIFKGKLRFPHILNFARDHMRTVLFFSHAMTGDGKHATSDLIESIDFV